MPFISGEVTMISRLQRLHSAPIFIATILMTAVCDSTKVVNIDRMSEAAFPYAEAGLTKREATAHLIDRFAFGAGLSGFQTCSVQSESEKKP